MPTAATSTAAFARQGILSREACRQHGTQHNREGLRSHRSCLLVLGLVGGLTRDREGASIDLGFGPSR
jgi:hypothetical protein